MKTCYYCGNEREEYLTCDKCKKIMCNDSGVDSGSCWHQHLQDEHGIDWTIHFPNRRKHEPQYFSPDERDLIKLESKRLKKKAEAEKND